MDSATVPCRIKEVALGWASSDMPRVIQSSVGYHLVTTRAYAMGEQVLCIGPRSQVLPSPDRYSVQVGVGLHAVPTTPHQEDMYEAWRYLNHHCTPSARWVGRALVARRQLGAGEEITFNYLTTEWEMDEPFLCRCGCGGNRIGGYRLATPEQRASIEGDLAAHIVQLRDGLHAATTAHAAASSHLR